MKKSKQSKNPQGLFEIPACLNPNGTKDYCEPGTRSGIFNIGRLQVLTFSETKDLKVILAKDSPKEVLVVCRTAKQQGRRYNQLASIVAGYDVYGDAVWCYTTQLPQNLRSTIQ